MQDAIFGKRHILHVVPLRRTPATISTDALILFIVFLAGYGLAAFLRKNT